MSIVDTWDWDKLKIEDVAEERLDADTKVRTAVYEFTDEFGYFPNRIIMGYKLLDEALNQFYCNTIPIKTLAELTEEKNLGVYAKYEGIPVEIDYKNPDRLEVGYMSEWLKNKC